LDISEVVSAVLLACGCFFAVSGGIGVLRMPDFYTRMHPAGKSDTAAQTLIFVGLIVHAGFSLVSVKLLLIMLFLFLTAPTATHAVAKAAYLSKLKPWRPGEPRR
jgi:multicomponent Na+:H+ antiporter subunit G